MTRVFRASFLPLAVALLLAPVVISPAHAASQVITGIPVDDSPTPDRAAAYYHFGLAKMYEDQAVANGRQDLATQAIEQYKLALSADPNAAALQNGLANLYFRLGRIREAVSAAKDQVAKHPNDVDAHTLLGSVYLRSLGDGQGPQSTEMLKAALDEYETIAKLKPDDPETHLLLGQLYGLDHDSAKAEAQLKLAQKIDGTSEEVVLSIARLYSEEGSLDKAAKAISDVPEGDRSPRMDFTLGAIYDELKKPKEAAEAYRATLDQDPDNAEARRALAQALTAAGDTDAAAKIYAEILGADPQDVQSLIHKADLERQKGNYEQALTTLKKASAMVSDNLQVNYSIALCYDSLGRFDEAAGMLNQMLTSSESADGKYSDADRNNRALFLERLAIIYREANKTDEAVGTYKQLAALGGEFKPRGAEGAIEAYREAHKYTQALELSADAAKEMPDNHEVQLTYASQLGDNNQVAEAQKLALAQLTNKPDSVQDDRSVYLSLADIDTRAKLWKDAAAALDKAEALAPKPEDKVVVYFFRGSVAEHQKLYDQAEAEFRKGLAIDPDNAAIENYLGYMFAERGVKLDEAVTLLKKVVAWDPQNGAYLDSLAWAYFKQGQYALAEEYALKAVTRMGTDPAIMDHLGEIYAKNGKLTLAIAAWQRSLGEYAMSLPPEADPADVTKVQHKLEAARVKLAHSGPAPVK